VEGAVAALAAGAVASSRVVVAVVAALVEAAVPVPVLQKLHNLKAIQQ